MNYISNLRITWIAAWPEHTAQPSKHPSKRSASRGKKLTRAALSKSQKPRRALISSTMIFSGRGKSTKLKNRENKSPPNEHIGRGRAHFCRDQQRHSLHSNTSRPSFRYTTWNTNMLETLHIYNKIAAPLHIHTEYHCVRWSVDFTTDTAAATQARQDHVVSP